MVDFAATGKPPEVVIERLTRTIVEKLKPRRVILIGSRARGDARPDSDYDVVVEFEPGTRNEFDLARDVYGLFTGEGLYLDVIIRIAGVIERRADDPGTLDWDIAREGKVLYSADGETTVLPRRPSDRVRETPREEPPSVKEWVRKAERDMANARRFLNEDDQWDYVCFFAQQSAEKYMKAALVRHFVRPPHTHSLTELLAALSKIGYSLPHLDADCALLTPYVVTARYRDSSEFTESIGKAAVSSAERIAQPLYGYRNDYLATPRRVSRPTCIS